MLPIFSGGSGATPCWCAPECIRQGDWSSEGPGGWREVDVFPAFARSLTSGERDADTSGTASSSALTGPAAIAVFRAKTGSRSTPSKSVRSRGLTLFPALNRVPQEREEEGCATQALRS